MTLFLPIILLSAAIPLYVYAGYPLLLWTLVAMRGRRRVAVAPIEPDVTFIISAYNEEAVIGEKLVNTLAIDYPRNRIEVIVVSDCSSDRTDALVSARAPDGVRLIRLPRRMGKTAGVNLAVASAKGEFLVFSDANAMYRRDAIRHLVANFADPEVGCVTGESRYSDPARSTVSTQENFYWKYERLIKILESDLGSMVGSDGAILALRRALFEPLAVTDLNDLVIPLRVVARGFRVVYERRAICDEPGTLEYQEEFRRKVRIVNRSVFALRQFPSLLNPTRAGVFAVQLFSHKVLRWSVGLALGVLLVSSAAAGSIDRRWVPLLWAQIGFYSLAGAGALFPGLRRRAGPVLTLPYYFCLVNAAALIGGVRGLIGQVQITWSPERGHGEQETRRHVRPWIPIACVVMAGALVAVVPTAARWTVWGSLAALAYVYIFYPMLIWAIAGIRRRTVRVGDATPSVTLVICAYNESTVLAQKLLNCLELDYPRDRLHVLLVSDGSTDGTEAIAQGFRPQGVEVIASPTRRGKSGAITAATDYVRGEVIVLSDTNVFYAPSALRKLVRNFEDPSVGAVSGNVHLINDHLFYRKLETWYYRYEAFLQRQESRTGTMLGADGAMYAVRRELFRPPGEGMILDDFLVAINVVRQGRRVVFDAEAMGREISSPDAAAEWDRRVRVVTGAIQSIRSGVGLPGARQGMAWFQYVSHKALRWLTPFFLVGFFFGSVASAAHPPFAALTLIQLAFYSLALCGAISRKRSIFFAAPFYFVMVSAATAWGIWVGLSSRPSGLWDVHRVDPAEVSASPSLPAGSREN